MKWDYITCVGTEAIFTPQQRDMIKVAGRLWYAVSDPQTGKPNPNSLPNLELLM